MKKRFLLGTVVAVSIMALVGCGGSGDGGDTFTATTSSFEPGKTIPLKYAKKGDNINPEVSWKNAPDGTKYVAVIMDDPDAQSVAGKTWAHWAVYNIDVAKGKIEEGKATTCPLPDLEAMSTNSYGERGYGGPNPPKGTTHTYNFVVYGLNKDIDEGEAMMNDEMTNEKFKTKYKSIITGSAKFTGKYRSSEHSTNSIVGTWKMECYKPSDDSHARYRISELVFESNGTVTKKKIKYTDDKCTQSPEISSWRAKYKTGKATTGSDDKPAIELDVINDTDHWEYYLMYRFKDNGNLLVADDREGHDGSDPESRADYFDPSWKGYTKVK